ncbi:FapA family protein [Evansella sp. AB-P1]|uniref:DUF342 domain-containing protein n=1 Tax=Evansella sp. AB-P1 TaxID=3037653 RepID=UPI00241E2ADD|nr:FapA family protein [Evansella sp. AB-P1]MDG5788164.1 FapA family protein [Evansella sp. AB-P1]
MSEFINQLNQYLEIGISTDKMIATIKQLESFDEETKITIEDLNELLMVYGIQFGIHNDILQQIVEKKVSFPVEIAKGKAPIRGIDAYLKPLLPTQDKEDITEENTQTVDFKKVIEIPAVTQGTVVGVKVEKVEKVNGMNVFGHEEVAKEGRDIKLRPGKNTRVSENGCEIISTIDGQMSIERKVIHVFPIYEVHGDLDMKVGNIDFIGNVVIRGGVPSGYKVVAQGDIRILGSVESAQIESGGSVFIQQGIVAQGKGSIRANGDLHTSFINQGNVDVKGNIHVTQSILHSQVQAQGFVYCKNGRGNIVGGHISAGTGMEVNDVGNSMNTPTVIFLGINQQIINSQQRLAGEYDQTKDELAKLDLLITRLTEMEKTSGLSTKERLMKLRIRNTILETSGKLEEITTKLEDLKSHFEDEQDVHIKIFKNVFPNTDIHFGKYQRKIKTKHQRVLFKLDRSEITFESIH